MNDTYDLKKLFDTLKEKKIALKKIEQEKRQVHYAIFDLCIEQKLFQFLKLDETRLEKTISY